MWCIAKTNFYILYSQIAEMSIVSKSSVKHTSTLMLAVHLCMVSTGTGLQTKQNKCQMEQLIITNFIFISSSSSSLIVLFYISHWWHVCKQKQCMTNQELCLVTDVIWLICIISSNCALCWPGFCSFSLINCSKIQLKRSSFLHSPMSPKTLSVIKCERSITIMFPSIIMQNFSARHSLCVWRNRFPHTYWKSIFFLPPWVFILIWIFVFT